VEKKRNTIQRQLVFDAVRDLNIHASAEQVYEHVVQKYPTVSKATVYRNLSQMVESGDLLNIGYFGGTTHFDHNCHEHGHLMCKECKRIFDVDVKYSDIIHETCDQEGFDIIDYRVTFSGLCWDCKGKKYE